MCGSSQLASHAHSMCVSPCVCVRVQLHPRACRAAPARVLGARHRRCKSGLDVHAVVGKGQCACAWCALCHSVFLARSLFHSLIQVLAAVALNSRTVQSDAACSLGCIALSAVLFAGSGLRLLVPVLWWVDPVAALVIAALIAREGVAQVRASLQADFDGCSCHESNTDSWAYKRARARLRAGDGTLLEAVRAVQLQVMSIGVALLIILFRVFYFVA